MVMARGYGYGWGWGHRGAPWGDGKKRGGVRGSRGDEGYVCGVCVWGDRHALVVEEEEVELPIALRRDQANVDPIWGGSVER